MDILPISSPAAATRTIIQSARMNTSPAASQPCTAQDAPMKPSLIQRTLTKLAKECANLERDIWIPPCAPQKPPRIHLETEGIDTSEQMEPLTYTPDCPHAPQRRQTPTRVYHIDNIRKLNL